MEVEFELSGVVHRHKIDKPVFFVGRVSGNELRINDTTVSSKHARITDNPDLAIVEDLGSTNGTRLNNEQIRECAVKAGDCITFGRIPVRIISVGSLGGDGDGELAGDMTMTMSREISQTVRMSRPGPEDDVPGALELPLAGEDLAGAESKQALIPNQRLAAFTRVAVRLASARKLADLAERAGKGAQELVRAQGVEVFFADESSGAPVRLYGRAADGAEMPGRDEAALASFVPLMAARRAMLTAAAGAGAPRSLYAPLVAGEKSLGLIAAYVTGPVTAADLRLLALLGNEAGAALEGVRYAEKLRRTYDDLVREQTETIAECDQLEAALQAAKAEVEQLRASGAAAAAGGAAAAAPGPAPAPPPPVPSEAPTPTPGGGPKTPVPGASVPKTPVPGTAPEGAPSEAEKKPKPAATSIGIAIPGATKGAADLGVLLDALILELRAPVPQVQGLIDQTLAELARETAPPLVSQILLPAKGAAMQLGILLNDVTELADLEGGRVKLEPTAIDARALVGEVHHFEGMPATAKGVKFHLDAPATPLMVNTDPRRLVQMLHHLVSTAVKLSLPGKEVTLTVNEVPGRVRFNVRDQLGPLVHIGLGVAIAKRLAPILNCNLSIDGDPSRGTAMVFHLPLVAGKK